MLRVENLVPGPSQEIFCRTAHWSFRSAKKVETAKIFDFWSVENFVSQKFSISAVLLSQGRKFPGTRFTRQFTGPSQCPSISL